MHLWFILHESCGTCDHVDTVPYGARGMRGGQIRIFSLGTLDLDLSFGCLAWELELGNSSFGSLVLDL